MKVEIIHPGDGWVLDRLARILIERIPGAYGSPHASRAQADTDIAYFMHYGLFGQSHAPVRGCFMPHKEPPDAVFDMAARHAGFCVAPSRASVAECLPFNAATHLVYHGIDLQAFRPRLRIGFVGREYPSGRKGSEIFGFLRGLDFVDLRLTNGTLRDDEIPAFIGDMDYILIASKHEGGPLCFQEALASGVEVISTDVGMVSDFRDAPGVHLYPYNDLAALRQLLDRLLARRLQLRRTVERYSEAYFAEQHLQIFQRQLGR
ncbi:glycosyltransferase [Aquabacterium sp. OR-4]|uniref:glycosyltransferase n=1 Tax=Aquabacterium sp. OR-4 TaxID=2978127 RepID=UPI0021B22C59|nr:glycosyltransferase [Aquabacterium sp. OR-4]MDT7836546.1 hypothetical protein [Aquabacterium sp. OR-4]